MMSNLQPRARASAGVDPQCIDLTLSVGNFVSGPWPWREKEVERADCLRTRRGWPFVDTRRRIMKEVAVMRLMTREIIEELQQDQLRQVRVSVDLDVSAFSKNASSSPCTEVSSDEEVS